MSKTMRMNRSQHLQVQWGSIAIRTRGW